MKDKHEIQIVRNYAEALNYAKDNGWARGDFKYLGEREMVMGLTPNILKTHHILYAAKPEVINELVIRGFKL